MPVIKSVGFSSDSFVKRLWVLFIVYGPVYFSCHMAAKERIFIVMPRKPLYRTTIFFLTSVLWVARYVLVRRLGMTVSLGIDIVLAVVGIVGIMAGAGYFDALKESKRISLFDMVLCGLFPALTGLLVVPLWLRLFV